MRFLTLLTLPLLVACQSGDDGGEEDVVPVDGSSSSSTADTDTTDTTDTTSTNTNCAYPDGAVEPMAEGEVLTAYRWPLARHMDGLRTASLDLEHAPCDTDEEIDWSPHDVLVFVSIPAW